MKNLYYNVASFIRHGVTMNCIHEALYEINYRYIQGQSMTNFYNIVDAIRDNNETLGQYTDRFTFDEWVYVLEWAKDLKKLPTYRVKDLDL